MGWKTNERPQFCVYPVALSGPDREFVRSQMEQALLKRCRALSDVLFEQRCSCRSGPTAAESPKARSASGGNHGGGDAVQGHGGGDGDEWDGDGGTGRDENLLSLAQVGRSGAVGVCRSQTGDGS